MRRRNRKHRKPIQQETHCRTIATKGSNVDDLSCNRNLRHSHFNAKSEHISSSQFNYLIKNKPRKNARMKEKRNNNNKSNNNSNNTHQEPISDWWESNLFIELPSSKSSAVAFFIPLRNFYDPDDFNNIMERNTWSFYGSNSSSMISHYNNKRCKSNKRDKSMVSLEFPQLRKSRSSSESSITSDDSFICFEFTDDYDNDDEIRYLEDITDNAYPSSTSDIPFNSPETTSKKRKRVRFADNSELATVHVIIAWDFAYRAARISPWEIAARDATRFKLKIQSLEPIIAPVLNPEHRSKIWYNRMEKFYK